MSAKRIVAPIVAFALALLMLCQTSQAYIEIGYSLGRAVLESTSVTVARVEKVDTERNLIIYKKVADLKGKFPTDVIKHNIGKGGFHPREWQFIMAAAQPGKTAIILANGTAAETCIENYWYQCYPGGEWWTLVHGEPYFLRTFAGKPDKLIPLLEQMLAGKEVIVPCMVDGDKNALQLRTAKIQRLKASLKIQDYDPKRDFAGWGNEEFRRITNMPGFALYGSLGRVDPGAAGMAAADINGDGLMDVCLWGEDRTLLLLNAGTSFDEVNIGYGGGARGAAWGDYNGDGKPDLLLATPTGPRLFTNEGGGKFRYDTASLPRENYYNLTACAWIDTDGSGRQDILLANGFLGLRLYKYKGNQPPAAATAPKFGKWSYAGPFDNANGKGFDAVYPPERGVNLQEQYNGKSGEKVSWKESTTFADGQINSFLPLFKPEHGTYAVAYVYREIECPTACEIPASFGSDDGMAVWLNGQKIISANDDRSCEPDQNQATLKLKAGKNTLLMKVCQGAGEWAYYFAAKGPQAPVVQLFDDVSEKVGLGVNGIGSQAKGDHLAVADVNGDGRPDFLYSAGTGLLALNTPGGFVESRDSGIQYKAGRVTPVFGDIDGDKAADLFIPQLGGCKLYKNDGRGHFTDITSQAGLTAFNGYATCGAFANFSKTGRNDLFIGCLRGPNRYYKNMGGGAFVDAGEQIGFYQRIFNTRGLCVTDLNKNGGLDLAMVNEGQESCVLLTPGNPTTKPAEKSGK